MINILIRFFIVYFVTVISLRAMGKRQIGEMQMSELVTAFFLSELATYCITDYSVPLLYGILPVLCLISLEVIISFIAVKSKLFKELFYSHPSILIENGEISQKELMKNRITTEELFSAMRLKDMPDIQKIKYAILEANGQISIIPYEKDSSVTKSEMNIDSKENGFSRVIVDDGKINNYAIKELGKDKKWINKIIKNKKVSSIKDIFILTCDECENITMAIKEKK